MWFFDKEQILKEAQLFEVDVDTLLGNGEREKSSTQEEVTIGKMPWIFIGISALGNLETGYALKGLLLDSKP